LKSIIRFLQPSKKSYFLFGPRGTGKSTWVKKFYPTAAVLDLLEPNLDRLYKAAPERLYDFVDAHDKTTHTFIIDEVQKSPPVLSVVHSLIEKNKRYQFILTGSSSRKLKKTGVDLLAGRAQLKTLHSFMPSELGDQFQLQHAMKFGLLPLVLDSADPTGDLKSYIALYMKEEVQLEGLVRHIDQFARFLEAMSFSQASVVNYSNIARECHVSNPTVENYVTILEDLLLAFLLPVFTKKAKRHLITKPKFYYFDAGVYASIRPTGPLDEPAEMNGPILETIVAQTFRAWLAYSSQEGKLFFWRSKSGLEVDFVIYGEIGFYAIEVKNTTKIRPADLRSLQEFQLDYPTAQCVFLYRGKEKIKRGSVLCYPVEAFLKKLIPDQTWPT